MTSHRAHPLGQQLGRLSRTLHLLRQHVAAHAPEGVQWATFTLLFHLVSGGPQRSRALADAVSVDPSTVSRQVDQLVRLGLVERRADPEDGRAALLAATESGMAVHADLREQRDRFLDAVLADWDDADLDALVRLMTRLNDDLAGAWARTAGRDDAAPAGAPRPASDLAAAAGGRA